MSSAKKPLQVSVRMLLRGPSDRGGVLIRQRCTSRLRRWTWRLHRHTAGSDGGHLQEEAVVHDTHLSLVSGVTPSFGPSSRPDSTCSTRSLDEVAQAPDSCRQTTARISLSAETQATAQGSSKHRAMGPHFSSRLSSNEHGTRASWHATSGEARGETFNLQAQHHGRRFTLQAGTWEAQPVQGALPVCSLFNSLIMVAAVQLQAFGASDMMDACQGSLLRALPASATVEGIRRNLQQDPMIWGASGARSRCAYSVTAGCL